MNVNYIILYCINPRSSEWFIYRKTVYYQVYSLFHYILLKRSQKYKTTQLYLFIKYKLVKLCRSKFWNKKEELLESPLSTLTHIIINL